MHGDDLRELRALSRRSPDYRTIYVYIVLAGPKPPADVLARLMGIQAALDEPPPPHIAKAQSDYLRSQRQTWAVRQLRASGYPLTGHAKRLARGRLALPRIPA